MSKRRERTKRHKWTEKKRRKNRIHTHSHIHTVNINLANVTSHARTTKYSLAYCTYITPITYCSLSDLFQLISNVRRIVRLIHNCYLCSAECCCCISLVQWSCEYLRAWKRNKRKNLFLHFCLVYLIECVLSPERYDNDIKKSFKRSFSSHSINSAHARLKT